MIVIRGLCFLLIDWLPFEDWGAGGFGGLGVRFKLDVQVQEGGRILDVDGQRGWGLENWTIFMDVICASSLKLKGKNCFNNE